ncbi:FHA domain-containing protein [bacterium]|nr:MAG: FHA domain-containing protein [bacterium]
MTATLRWNRLTITADGEEEFVKAVTEFFPQLLELPYEELEMDITKSKNISEDAFRSIAIKLVSGEASDKKMLIRIPDAMERYFRHSSLFRVVDVDIVRRMTADKKDKYTREIIKRNIESGEIAAEADEAEAELQSAATRAPASELTERSGSSGATKLKLGESDVDTVSNRKSVFPTVGGGDGPTELAPEPDQKGKKTRDTTIAGKSEYGALLDDETGNRHEIKDNIVVGREAPATVLYPVPTISKRHFTIRKQAGGFFIEDLHSTNGTYLNGLPVHEPQPLRDGDEIVVAITLKHPKGARIFHFTTKQP